ncbi:DoxX family protein [Caballeronia zhejiangensis]|uniref:DoxX family protein n=2 Tax=Caballeronia TaxID=1827195 RepID=UPI001FD13EBA|nr:DoxX family protein [Caballeronia zhejiangensis]
MSATHTRPSAANASALAVYAHALLRIVASYLLLTHASAKLFHVPHIAMFDGLPLVSLLGVAGVIELIGGVLVLIGLFTRAAAFVLSGELAFAYFIGHAPKGNFLLPLLNQGEPAVLLSFIYLFIAAAGPGAWSIDGRRRALLRPLV